ncbi:MAG: hypothetical protein KDE28_22325 [Anaerolineales bacterium]|nr:hypothetical protein [Anaerolineales bacterium]
MKVAYSTFSCLIVDDIVFPDGQTRMNVLGGGLHALTGMRVWSDSVGIAAAVGHDLDEQHREGLQAFGVDISGLVRREELRTARSWQLFETNGHRTEILRTDRAIFTERKVQFEDLPDAYLDAKVYHVQWGRPEELPELLSKLRAASPSAKLVMELTYPKGDVPHSLWRQIMSQLSLISPDREEATTITGLTDPLQSCRMLLDWGAPLVALRMGAEGSILMDGTGRSWHLPAVPTNIVDVTGGGNSYCGGFTVGLGEGLDPVEAALRAVVSASFALEQIGTPSWDDSQPAEALRRLDWARQRVEEIVNPA